MNRISLTIVSSLENSRLVGLCAREIACRTFNDEALAEIELATVEAINNCIEHACAESDKHQITIEFLLSEDRLSIELIDQGKAMEPEWLDNLNANFDCDDIDLENLSEGGRGLKIVKSCMDEVSYQNRNEHNRWLLIKYTGAIKN
ncbi:MAG: ATP-binding protein [Methylococcales bacterium]